MKRGLSHILLITITIGLCSCSQQPTVYYTYTQLLPIYVTYTQPTITTTQIVTTTLYNPLFKYTPVPLRLSSGYPIVLWGNPMATNPTYVQLLDFLKHDNTDEILYVPDEFVCSNFAETLQHNAESLNIKCGIVHIEFINDKNGHVANVFQTLDAGTIYIDCTGYTSKLPGLNNRDEKVSIKEGIEYTPVSLFPELNKGWNATSLSMGVIESFEVMWP